MTSKNERNVYFVSPCIRSITATKQSIQ